MRGPSWLIVFLTFLFEIVAFGLAIGAMTRRSKATLDMNIDYEFCDYTSDIATGLAAGAIVSLVIGHAIMMGLTGCFCCGSGSYKGKARAGAIIAFALAWFSFIIAVLTLIVGARVNRIRTKTILDYAGDETLSCKEVRKGVFAAGAAFTFLTLVFSELYYLALVRASQGSWDESYKTGAPTISMTAYP